MSHRTSLARCVLTTILALSSVLSAEPYLTLDSLVGSAQVRRAGRSQWTPVAVKDFFLNNDMLKVHDSSWARLTWSDNGTTAIVRANSQMLINAYENPSNNRITKHFTLFAGAAFYIVKAALPEGLFGPEDTKVFTPTMVIAIRGTSFGVKVDKTTGHSTLEVLNGTVLVRNIVQNVSSFVRAGYWTAVDVGTEVIETHPMIDKEIYELKQWVPPAVIDSEIKAQAKTVQSTRMVTKEEPANRILVVPLENSSTYQGPWEIGKRLADVLAASIGRNAPSLDVQVKGDPKADPLAWGSENNARLLIRGSIEEFDISQRAKISARADAYNEQNTALVRIRLQVIDVKGNRVLFDDSFAGEVTRKNTADATWKAVSKLKFDLENRGFATSILGEAVRQAIEQAAGEVNRYVR